MKLTFCAACGTTKGLDHHHLRPRVHGGSDAETNLITLCHECHGKMHGADWGEGNFWSNKHKELQQEGIERARREGKYKGRKGLPTETIARVRELRASGMGATDISKSLHIARASVYRCLPPVPAKETVEALRLNILSPWFVSEAGAS
jgi:Helix-turn-helix domain of resolvase/HNH endonuclease